MLKEIRCNVFKTPVVKFHAGLNVILGDDIASNSIGKSTMLMIIDFVFGGGSYITANHDAIETLGDHSFNFCFKFGTDLLYFTRTTKRCQYVTYCNKDYDPINEIILDDYKNLLSKKYKVQLQDMSFREIISLYSRIWGKKNYDIDKPLQISNENASSAIIRLIKLFERYAGIKSLELQVLEFTEKKKSLESAMQKEYLPKINREEYNNSLAEIKNIEDEMKTITNEIFGIKVNYDAIVSKEILELKDAKSALIQQRNIDINRLKKTRINIALKNPSLSGQLIQLKEFFPDIDMERLSIIDSFHSNISSILKDTLKETEQELEDKINYFNEKIQKLDHEIDRKINFDNIPKYTSERLTDLATRKIKLNKGVELFEIKQALKNNLLIADKDLAEIKENILDDISSKINIKMNELNNQINPDGRRTPNIKLEEKRYKFQVFNDTGTGKAYSNLITLDLAIFCITKLPILIHDTMLFKNIENSVIENVVNIYKQQKKQVFISIDEINKFAKETTETLEKKHVLKLSYNKTLFIKDWKKGNSDAADDPNEAVNAR
jgi:phosphotransferase system IIB component